MPGKLTRIGPRKLTKTGRPPVPAVIAAAGEKASRRFLEFFAAEIRNRNTRLAYARAVSPFLDWCEARGRELHEIDPVMVAAYIEQLAVTPSRNPRVKTEVVLSKPTIKQNLAAIRGLFDYLVTGGVIPFNPASSVRGPKYSIKRGKTPVLNVEEIRGLFRSIDATKLVGLRDRALIAVMFYTFARVGAVVSMRVDDYYQQGKRWFVRLHEKGGKHHTLEAHHKLQEYLDAYLEAAGLWQKKKSPLFPALYHRQVLSDEPLPRHKAWEMIKRRSKAAGLSTTTSPHSWRGSGITEYLRNGGSIETAQEIAAHESSRTTKLYDRSQSEITLDEIERIPAV
jgi:site-specific recombinase XerD